MKISSYEDLLNAANKQAEPQRLLFVFTGAGLPDDHTQDQEKQFKARKGGTLTPVMCVDKLASERIGFAGLVEESRQTGADWDIVFVACMASKSKIASNSEETEQPFKTMIKSIQDGSIGNFLAFNRDGELVQFR
ncbi:MAG: ribonucleotide reductase subunit alpha [Gallionella sp.]|nr:ribonucleotide reductase subunit alpha [Gallionella sp.]